MITAGNSKELSSSVLNLADNSPKYDGTIYAFIWLEDDVDGYAGKFWDGSAWSVGPNSFPSATHIKGSVWSYTLPATATTGYEGSFIHWTMADSSSEADVTTICEHYEMMIYPDVVTNATIADAVWDELQADHTTSTTFGAIESNIRGPDDDDLKVVSDAVEAIPSPTEMSFASWGVNENINVKVFVADPVTGNGLTGQVSYIDLTIQRASDDKYWTGSTWQVASYNLTMTETDSVNQPGSYKYVLSGSTGNTQQDSYTAYATVDNPGTVTGQNFEIHISRDSTVNVYESEPA